MADCYLSVVIPAWNEEKRLPGTLSRCIQFLNNQSYTSEIIVVSDGSKDATVQLAETFKTEYPSLRVLDFPFNRGKGFGVKEGMLAASGRFRLFMDADYAVPIDLVTTFLDTISDRYDIVVGSRAHGKAVIRAEQPFPRRQLALAFGWLQWLILRLPYRDTQCGFKLFTAKAAEQYFPQLIYECAYFDAELVYMAYHSRARMIELPVVWTHDQETRLPIGFKRSCEILKKLFRIRKLHASTKTTQDISIT